MGRGASGTKNKRADKPVRRVMQSGGFAASYAVRQEYKGKREADNSKVTGDR